MAVLAGDVSDVDGSAVGVQWACALGAGGRERRERPEHSGLRQQ